MAPSGLLVIDKPSGCTSHDVVSRVRRLYGTRKVGHAGTLDPMATGVLIVGLERATRLLGYLALKDKEYLATIRLGSSTVTDDAEGEVLEVAPAGMRDAITADGISAAIGQLTGTIEQVPSAVSAIKVDGKRAHARIRAGDSVDLASRTVQVDEFALLDCRREAEAIDLDVRVHCSTGTYVRALARDLGAALEVGGHLTALRRTRVGPWRIEAATPLEALASIPEPMSAVLGIDQVAACSFPAWHLDGDRAEDVRHGRRIPWDVGDRDEPVACFGPDGRFLALAERAGPAARYLAVFA
jgi:tRNA pseudouridine55 synthase